MRLLAEKDQSIAALSDDVAFYRDVLSRGVATVEEKVDAVHAVTQDIQQALGELSDLVSGAFMDELRGAKETLRAQLETAPPEAQDALVDAMCRQVNDAINSAMAHASDAIVSQEEAHLERLFGESWQKLLPLSRASIVSASVLWQGCAGVTMPDFDYSGICISVTTALEAELRRVFFDGFGDYLVEKYGAPETLAPEDVFAIWPEKLLSMTQREYARAKKPKLKRQHVFTIAICRFFSASGGSAFPALSSRRSCSGGQQNISPPSSSRNLPTRRVRFSPLSTAARASSTSVSASATTTAMPLPTRRSSAVTRPSPATTR